MIVLINEFNDCGSHTLLKNVVMWHRHFVLLLCKCKSSLCARCVCIDSAVAHFYEVISAVAHIYGPFVQRNLLRARQGRWALWENLHIASSREARCWILSRVKEHRSIFLHTTLRIPVFLRGLSWRANNLGSNRWPGLYKVRSCVGAKVSVFISSL